MKAPLEALRSVAPASVMAASGFAGLGYQIVWTQQCSLWLGHEAAAVLAVVSAFFGGLALGGIGFGARIERSQRPLHWYAGCEVAIAVWSWVLVAALPLVSSSLELAVGASASPLRQWSVAFLGTFVAFLPATAAMGATLPALERLIEPLRSGRSITALYAANTFGAVLGVLASAFWLIPNVGLRQSAIVCSALNLLAGGLAVFAFRERGRTGRSAKHAAKSAAKVVAQGERARAVLVRLAVTGFLGIGYEVTVVRVLSQVTEDTVFTFALLLAVYLLGTAGGAFAYRRWLESRKRQDELGDRLLALLAAACLVGAGALWAAESIGEVARDRFGPGLFGAVAAEGVLALATFGLPTPVMGALFAHLSRSASAAGVSFGRAFGINTLAAAAAPVLCGVWAIPALGAKLTLVGLALGYLASTRRDAWVSKEVGLVAAAALAVVAFAPPLQFVEVPENGRIVSYVEGTLAAVGVSEDAEGVRRLRINNRQQEGTNNSLHVDARQAWLPLLLRPAPRRALFLGLGTGVTATSAAADDTLEVTAVELLPEVIAVSPDLTAELFDETVRRRLHAVAADARRFVRTSERRYDIIVSDNFHPARSGSGSLYTVEHFRAVRERLESGGVFCQWLPLHQLDLPTLRSIVAAFVSAFPTSFALLASNSLETPVVGLVAAKGEGRFELAAVRERLARLHAPAWWGRLGLDDEYAVLGSFIAGPEALRRFSATAAVNTDDQPVVAYSAPRATYAPDSSPRDRLSELLGQVTIRPEELLAPSADPNEARRLGAYFLGRDRFIDAGRHVQPSPRVEDMLAQVREPLLSVLRISPDFRPAYDPLISMAAALARSNVSEARTLLSELTRLQPSRTEASQLLRSIDQAPTSKP